METTADLVRYNAVARVLHWAIAIPVVINLGIGLMSDEMRDQLGVMPLHKALGMTVLALTLARIGWRFTWKMPPWPETMGRLQQILAHSTHGVLYLLMLALPLTGWVFSSASKWPISWFGLFDIPKFAVTKDMPIAHLTHNLHGLLGWVALALVAFHVGAALHHQFVAKDRVLRRML